MLINSLASPEGVESDERGPDVPSEPNNPETWADVFETEDRHHHPELPAISTSGPSDVARLQAAHSTAGYRDGVSTAKSSYVQAGFDEGYGLGGEIGRAVGSIIGSLEGLVATAIVMEKISDSSVVGAADLHSKELVNPENLQTLSHRARATLTAAKKELDIGHIFGKDYITEDGVWKWVTDGDENDEGLLFRDIALKHPLVARWQTQVDQIIQEFHLNMNQNG
jgi:hypothetical protein